jgi:hypothetical protein
MQLQPSNPALTTYNVTYTYIENEQERDFSYFYFNKELAIDVIKNKRLYKHYKNFKLFEVKYTEIDIDA